MRRLISRIRPALACAVLPFALLARVQEPTPRAAMDALFAADRAFSAKSAGTDLVSGLAAMFSETVIVPLPGGQFAEGRARAIEALRANPDNLKSRVEWTPLGGGVSADGQHGFTFGRMTVRTDDGKTEPAKYLAYWVREPAGWRVAAYKRGRAIEGPAGTALPSSLPSRLVPASTDAAAIARHRDSLADAERSFSKDAQTMGLGAAFTKYGRTDAVNMGGPKNASFVVGNEAIGRLVGEGEPATGSSVSWGPDKGVLVASSGDLGVTFGIIRRNTPTADPKQPSAFPFFTVWRRDSPTGAWRYIAE
jgi:ketosteroid isomerase-like protein